MVDVKCEAHISFEGDRTIYRFKGCDPYLIKMQHREFTIYEEVGNGWEFVDYFYKLELAVSLMLEKVRKK